MEVRPTKMLTEKELREDLGISRDQLLNFIDLEIFRPIRLGVVESSANKKSWNFKENMQVLT